MEKGVDAENENKQDKGINPDTIKVLLQELKPYADLFKDHLKNQTESSNRVFYILLGFLGVLIALAAFLVFYSKISGDAFMFLVGTIVGYVLGFSLELAKKRWL